MYPVCFICFVFGSLKRRKDHGMRRRWQDRVGRFLSFGSWFFLAFCVTFLPHFLSFSSRTKREWSVSSVLLLLERQKTPTVLGPSKKMLRVSGLLRAWVSFASSCCSLWFCFKWSKEVVLLFDFFSVLPFLWSLLCLLFLGFVRFQVTFFPFEALMMNSSSRDGCVFLGSQKREWDNNGDSFPKLDLYVYI